MVWNWLRNPPSVWQLWFSKPNFIGSGRNTINVINCAKVSSNVMTKP
jgi:hypothetical protein